MPGSKQRVNIYVSVVSGAVADIIAAIYGTVFIFDCFPGPFHPEPGDDIFSRELGWELVRNGKHIKLTAQAALDSRCPPLTRVSPILCSPCSRARLHGKPRGFLKATRQRMAELALRSVTSPAAFEAQLFPSELPLLPAGSLLGTAAAPAAKPACSLSPRRHLPAW